MGTVSLKLPEKSSWLRAGARGVAPETRVDREARVIHGYVVAQAGPFREPDPRGEFDTKSLKAIVQLMKVRPGGVKSRFGHPSLSGDGIGTFLGRAKDPRLDSVAVKRDGETVELEAVRADLHFSRSATSSPNGNLADYLMDLAEEDPSAFGSSLVLQVVEEFRIKDGTRARDNDGRELPPLWRPTVIHASDVVDEGAAVDQFLSADEMDSLPDAVVRHGARLLDGAFAGQPREVVEARCLAWLGRYLALRYGVSPARQKSDEEWWPGVEDLQRRLRLAMAG